MSDKPNSLSFVGTALTVKYASTDINEDEKYCTIAPVSDVGHGLTHVRLYESILDHVTVQHAGNFPPQFYPTFPSIIHAVGDAIKSPISTEPSYNNSVRFVGASVNARNHPLNVYVQKITGTTSGYITSFFFTSRVQDDDDE